MLNNIKKHWDQWLIFLTGAPAVAITQLNVDWLLPYAAILGLVGQVGWWNATYKARQWGMFWTCFLYTGAWLIGVYTFWIVK